MSENTSNLSLPYIQPSQAQKHVTHNLALQSLDALVQTSALSQTITAPPNAPGSGDIYIIAAGATGAWAGHDTKLAFWQDNSWQFLAPSAGWRAWVVDTGQMAVFDGAGWSAIVPDLQNLPGVGVNSGYDPVNRLSVSAPASLFNHEGAGHQLKINKAASGDTASLVFQDNYSGRAEMGLAGDDDFKIKTSADGVSFTDAIIIDKATGKVSTPHTKSYPRSEYVAGCFYCYTNNRWVGYSSSYGHDSGSFNQTGGLGTEPFVDWDQKGPLLRAGTIIKRFTLSGNMSNGEVTAFHLRLFFQHGPWDATWDSVGETTRVELYSQNNITLSGGDMFRLASTDIDFTVPDDGYLIMIIQPVGTITGTRYLRTSTRYDLIEELP